MMYVKYRLVLKLGAILIQNITQINKNLVFPFS